MGYYLLAIGAVISCVSIWFTFKNLRLLLWGTRTLGVIVGIDEQMRRGDNRYKKVYYHPVIEFETAEGHPFQFTFGSGSTRKRPLIGKEVTVIYESGQPDKATLNSFMGLWAGPLAAGVLGGGCIYGGMQVAFFGA